MAPLTLELLGAEVMQMYARLEEKFERTFAQSLSRRQNIIQVTEVNEVNEELIKPEEPEEIQIETPNDSDLAHIQIEEIKVLERSPPMASGINFKSLKRFGIFQITGRNFKGILQTLFKNEAFILDMEEYLSKGFARRIVQVFKTLVSQLQNQETLKFQQQNQDFLVKFKKDEIRRMRKKVRKKKIV